MVYFTTIVSRRQILQQKQKLVSRNLYNTWIHVNYIKKMQEDKADMNMTFISPNYLKYEFNCQNIRAAD